MGPTSTKFRYKPPSINHNYDSCIVTQIDDDSDFDDLPGPRCSPKIQLLTKKTVRNRKKAAENNSFDTLLMSDSMSDNVGSIREPLVEENGVKNPIMINTDLNREEEVQLNFNMEQDEGGFEFLGPDSDYNSQNEDLYPYLKKKDFYKLLVCFTAKMQQYIKNDPNEDELIDLVNKVQLILLSKKRWFKINKPENESKQTALKKFFKEKQHKVIKTVKHIKTKGTESQHLMSPDLQANSTLTERPKRLIVSPDPFSLGARKKENLDGSYSISPLYNLQKTKKRKRVNFKEAGNTKVDKVPKKKAKRSLYSES